jgi:aryl-alcohol dehydrogenase-like predicted oxidoreductase
LVNRVGVSIYDVAQLESMEIIFDAGIVQFPYNVFDSRVVTSDVFARLKSAGVEMHARSAFLQGLLLMERSQLPEYFAPVRNELSQLHAEWAAAGVSRLSGCLGFVLRNPDVDALMVGVNSLAEFEGIREAIAEAAHGDFRIAGRFEPDVEFVDPSRWPSFAR